MKGSRDEGWVCSHRSPPKESKNAPRTHWPGWKGSSGGAGGGNRRSVVQRDCIVLVFTCTCQIQGSAGRDARKCSGSLALQVGFDAQLCCCSGVLDLRGDVPNAHDVDGEQPFRLRAQCDGLGLDMTVRFSVQFPLSAVSSLQKKKRL